MFRPVSSSTPNIITYVMTALTINQADPAFLELEITENVLMNGVGSTLETLNSLHDLESSFH